MRIYTKTGDKGETALLSGTRVPKNHPHIEAYGTVDECNSAIGLACSLMAKESCLVHLNVQLESIQKSLFDLGAALSLPLSEVREKDWLSVKTDYASEICSLETWMDKMTEDLPQLKQFILPGGTSASSALHLARTICRRAERLLLPLLESNSVNVSMLSYLNRLSDYLFVLSRYVNYLFNIPDQLWHSSNKELK